jgi:hypothetical protein
MAQGRRITAADHEKIFALRCQGLTIRQIAKRIGLNKSTVQRVFLDGPRGAIVQPNPGHIARCPHCGRLVAQPCLAAQLEAQGAG